VSLVRVICATAAAFSLSACVVAPYAPAGYYAGGEPVTSTDVGPPPPYTEVVPVAPFVGAVWLSGYWGWSAGRHVWVGGHWVRPQPGHVWSPYRWVPAGGRWHLHRGGWSRR
jgi:hypothetical protein